jgi:hypothetical protein
MPAPQSNPQMVQWQMRFDNAMRAAQEPQRPGETPQQAQQRVGLANQLLRQLQTAKPNGPGASMGQSGQVQGPPPTPQGHSFGLGGLYDYISRAMSGGR